MTIINRSNRFTASAAMLAMTMFASPAMAQDQNNDRETFCAFSASEFCFNSLGYTSVECEQDYYYNCLYNFDRNQFNRPPLIILIFDGYLGGRAP